MKFCQNRNIISQKKWIDQSNRFNKKLRPDYFKVDEKTISDFSRFASEYGKLISFFNENDRPDGDWSMFFREDPTISLFLLQSFDTEKWNNEIAEVFVLFEKSKNEKQKIEILKKIVIISSTIFLEIEQITMNVFTYKDFQNRLIKFITNRFSHFFNDIFLVNKFLIESHQWANPIVRNFEISFGKFWFHEASNLKLTEKYWIDTTINTVSKKLPKIIHDIEFIKEDAFSFLQNDVLNEGNVKPHIALFLTFCELYGGVQDKINTITERHLNYYYQDILKLKPLTGTFDSIFLTFVANVGSDCIQLNEGTKFIYESKNEDSIVNFILDKPLVINEGSISKVMGINVSSRSWKDSFMKKSDINFELHELNFPTDSSFEFGFEISSEYLILEEGDRRITFDFFLSRKEKLQFIEEIEKHFFSFDLEKINSLISNSWNIFYSTKEEMLRIEEDSLNIYFHDEFDVLKLRFDILIKKHLSPFSPLEIEENVNEAVLKFVLNENGFNYYSLFRDISFSKATLNIEVIGVRDLIIQNDFGALENGLPFEPFGFSPKIGSNLYIGHKNLFLKPLKDLVINLEWNNLPFDEQGFKSYYKDYNGIENNSSFKVKISALRDKSWVPSVNKQVLDLFTGVPSNSSLENNLLSPIRRLNEIDISALGLNYNARIIGPLENYDITTTDGFVKLELCYPEVAFGHDQYTELIQKMAFKASKNKGVTESVNEPYTPSIKSISLDYKSQIDISQWDERITLKKINPFGKESIAGKSDWKILPFFSEGGALLIGFDPLLSNKEISLLFKISNKKSINENELRLSIFENASWIPFSSEQITYDSTHQLQRDGIIKIKLPEASSYIGSRSANSIWLRIDINKENILSFIENIHLNAGIAIRETELKNNSSFVPEFSISEMMYPLVQINKIEQPYKSFGGRLPENEIDFRIRTSERIRHKSRAISIQDIENILLGEFPEIQSLKCLCHLDKNLEFKPGAILVVIVPLDHNDEISYERYFPNEFLVRIQEFLSSKIMTGMSVSVINPIYEKVSLKFNVKFIEGYNEKLGYKKLKEKIISFLDPWKSEKLINQGGIIPSTLILNEIELEDYVDYITNFSVFHIVNDEIINLNEAQQNDLIIKGNSPISILIPDIQHKILAYNDKMSTDNPGINDMMIGNDFLVKNAIVKKSAGLGFDLLEKTFQLSSDSGKLLEKKRIFTLYLKD
jgi:hypothetical protein